jgi:glycerol-3-phosphate dehydrogenase (NAD(P)+)
MGFYTLIRYLIRRISPEDIYRFFEARPDFPILEKYVSPFSKAFPEDKVYETTGAYQRAKGYIAKISETADFSPGEILDDLATSYDMAAHKRARQLSYYLILYLFEHANPRSPFLSKNLREAKEAPALKKLREKKRPILFIPNYNSHLDSIIINTYLDSLGLGIPFSAIGDLLILNADIENELKRLKVIKVTKSLLWSEQRPSYEAVLSSYSRALLEEGAHMVVHAEASRYTTRSIDGTLRATVPPWITDALISSERDVLIVPLSLSLSRVPEDRALVHRRPLAGILTLRDRATDIPIIEYLRFGRGYIEHLFTAMLDAMEGVYGKAYVTIGEPFSFKELISDSSSRQNPTDLISRKAMEGVAKNKKVLPSYLVPQALLGKDPLTMKELTFTVEEELEKVISFSRGKYQAESDIDDLFLEGIPHVIEEGLSPLLQRKIVSASPRPRRRYSIRNPGLGRFYANQLDHRIYPAKSGRNVTVINAGAFGYTLTTLLGKKFDKDPDYANYGLILFDTRRNLVEAINELREHPHFFKGHALPKVVHVESDLMVAVRGADVVVMATPSHYFRNQVSDLLDSNPDPFVMVIATKGFETKSGLLPVEIAWEEMEKRGRKDIRLSVISGANLAGEIIEGKLTATQLAVESEELAKELKRLFETPDFIVYLSRDLVGTQLAAAMKNVYAIAYGISEGAKDSSVNFTATLVTRISAEIKELALAMGADDTTFGPEGQAWMADFLATARGGRNSQFGKSLTKWSAPLALRRFRVEKKNVEGYGAVEAAIRLSKKYNVRLPIVEVLYNILYEGEEVDPRRFLKEKGSD